MSLNSLGAGAQVLRTKYLVPIVLGLLITLHAATFAADQATKLEQSDAIAPKHDVIRLFDGKTLGDCYTWLKDTKRDDPRTVFRVTDGMLHITGDGLGGLVTNKRSRDYHLVLEFKFGERTWQHSAK